MAEPPEWICRFCGSGDIVAEIEIRVDRQVGGRIRERDGKPYFDEDWRSRDLDLDYDDGDVAFYVCVNGHTAASLDKLVVRRRVFGEMSLPCGRCDHGILDHLAPEGQRELTAEQKRRFTRPSMPCEHEGCDCHDFYDQALGRERWPADRQEQLAA